MTTQPTDTPHSITFVERIGHVLHRYLAVRQTRRELAQLSDHLLTDIGLLPGTLEPAVRGRHLQPLAPRPHSVPPSARVAADLPRAA